MSGIRFDFNNMFSTAVGNMHGVKESQIRESARKAKEALAHLIRIVTDKDARIRLALEWTQLPFQNKSTIGDIQRLGKEIAQKYENVIFLGIGGSYLGLKAAQDALAMPYANEFAKKSIPRIYFEGNNLDPDTLSVLLKNLNPRKTLVVVISKSGETTETKLAFIVVEDWLKKATGKNYGRQIFAITDPESGSLRKKVIAEQKKDVLSFKSLPLLKGVGGRFSEFNMGLLHLAVIGVKIQEVLRGAEEMSARCQQKDLYKNPALLYAVLHTILYRKKGKSIAILMPFSETLKSTADWYVQLLAESLGKKFARKIIVDSGGSQRWVRNTERTVNIGRTPISARGTNDLHSIQQNNIEGENNKVITFVRVDKCAREIIVPEGNDFL
ncbi:MAG: hypothetical protein KKC84_02890, partial [Candidatus Omnitrophica bacterium]|nr:hypothetical protein [Candidatus Omnitrophota bacterium]